MPPIHLTRAVKGILIINVVFFLISYLLQTYLNIDSFDWLGIHDISSPLFRPWQLVTHIFMHDGFMHIFSNMLALVIYGPYLERYWGFKKFLQYYFFTAFGAVALHGGINYFEIQKLSNHYNQFVSKPSPETFLSFAQQNKQVYSDFVFTSDTKKIDAEQFAIEWSKTTSKEQYLEVARTSVTHYFESRRDVGTVGASGAVFGLILAFGIYFSEVVFYVYFAFPVKAKYLVLFHGAYEIYKAYANNPGDNVAHFAHIGGMIFGFILIKIWQHKKKSIN